MRILPQTVDPSNSPFGGEITSNGTFNQLRHATGGGVYVSLFQGGSSGSSACLSEVAGEGPFANNSGVMWTNTVTCSLDSSVGNGYYGTGVGASVTVSAWMECRSQTASASTFEIQVTDQTDGGAVIYTRTIAGSGVLNAYSLTSATTNWQRAISFSFVYSPTYEGTISLRVEIRKGGGGAGINVECRDVGCRIFGATL
jgi:hypothetical protein